MCEQFLDAFEWYRQMGRISRERALAVLYVMSPSTDGAPVVAAPCRRPCWRTPPTDQLNLHVPFFPPPHTHTVASGASSPRPARRT